ncbi:hypothetical protein BC937DRAFT_88516 [Endogone sp. FLAS-F59071]|nr:hypothetical protein BC937DRAFT_88516 [Endogone sp. FLAS-F59071]|eukprot:RUS23310.1 hypothetical protein BC937DRAFT_88516 [Endogone sp. FLAS-F59071]
MTPISDYYGRGVGNIYEASVWMQPADDLGGSCSRRVDDPNVDRNEMPSGNLRPLIQSAPCFDLLPEQPVDRRNLVWGMDNMHIKYTAVDTLYFFKHWFCFFKAGSLRLYIVTTYSPVIVE